MLGPISLFISIVVALAIPAAMGQESQDSSELEIVARYQGGEVIRDELESWLRFRPRVDSDTLEVARRVALAEVLEAGAIERELDLEPFYVDARIDRAIQLAARGEIDAADSELRHRDGFLGAVVPGQLAPCLYRVVFSLKVGERSEALLEEFGDAGAIVSEQLGESCKS